MNCKSFPIIKVTILLLVLGLVAYMVLYPINYLKPVERITVRDTTIIVNASNPSAADSVYRVFYKSKIDSIQNVLYDVNSKYQQEIDTSINKMNGWVAFWTSVVTFILSIAGLWQYLKVRSHDEKFSKQEKEVNDKLERKEYEINHFQSVLNANFELMSNRFRVENNLGLIMRTLAAIHDPSMVFDIAERRILVIEFIGKISKSLDEYSRFLLFVPVNTEVRDNYVCILMNIRLFLIRSTILFRSYNVNGEIRRFVDLVRQVEENIKNQSSVRENSVRRIVRGLNELQETMKRDSW